MRYLLAREQIVARPRPQVFALLADAATSNVSRHRT